MGGQFGAALVKILGERNMETIPSRDPGSSTGFRRVDAKPSTEQQLRSRESAMVMIRWAGVIFGVVQVATYYKPHAPGMAAFSLFIVGILAAANVGFSLALRRASTPDHLKRLALAGLLVDAFAIHGFVFTYTFDTDTAVWALIYILPLEAAMTFGLRGALSVMAMSTLAYGLREVYGSWAYGNDLLLTSITFRMGIGFLIAAVSGSTASSLMRQKRLLEEQSELARRLVGQLDEAQKLAGIGSWEWDLQADRLTWSHQLHEIYGVDPEVFEPTYDAFMERVHPDDHDEVQGLVQEAFATGRPFRFLYRMERADGEIRIVEARGTVLATEDGSPARMYGTCQDVTERQEAKAALERYAADLAATNRELKAANEVKDHILAVTNHELRSPLTVVLGFAGLLAERGDQVSPEERRDFSRAILNQAKRLNVLVDDLLTLAAAEAGGIAVHIEEVSVRAVLEAAAAWSGLPEDDVTIRCSPGLAAWADTARLHQIVSNYLANARQYGAPPIELDASRVGDTIEIRVIDRGSGVPEHFVPQLFEKFSQANLGTTRTAKGVGLGLAIVKQFAELQQGRAWYEPVPGGGAAFCVSLPAAAPSLDLAANDGAYVVLP